MDTVFLLFESLKKRFNGLLYRRLDYDTNVT